jgi:hypothetical protein
MAINKLNNSWTCNAKMYKIYVIGDTIEEEIALSWKIIWKNNSWKLPKFEERQNPTHLNKLNGPIRRNWINIFKPSRKEIFRPWLFP